ncbi:MAG: response regulator [Bdellovibrionaceae bacterium]|nr:response regulator [Pseudobdellovibrionaceae bacterium]
MSGAIRILIVDDDSSLGEALKEGLSRQGHEAVWVTKPEEALDLFHKQKFDFLLVDCLLPQMTGLELIEKAHGHSKSQFRPILMSGIYTDKVFVQEAIQKSQAIAFLKKPFDLADVSNLLKREVVQKADSPVHKHIYQIFSKEKVSVREKKALIDSLEDVSGYDLPLIYSLLCETKSTGYLNIYYPDGGISGVTFCSGSICSVDIEDKTTSIGHMLIQSGYITDEDLQTGLNDKSKKRLGVRLVQGNLLSPHAVDLIMTEQMNVRLSRTITSDRLKINFAVTENELTEPSIDSNQLLRYLHDWVASKIPVNWLKSLYLKWLGSKIILNSSLRSDHPAFQMSLLHALDGFEERLRQGTSLGQILSVPGYQETAVFKGIHFLLLRGLIYLSSKTEFKDEAEQLICLKAIKAQVNGKSRSDILTLLGTWEGGDSQVNIQETIASLGPKPTGAQTEVGRLWIELQGLFEGTGKSGEKPEGLQAGKLPGKRVNLPKVDPAEALLKANQYIEQVKKELSFSQFEKAAASLQMALSLVPDLFQSHLYHAWIKLGSLGSKSEKFKIKEIELDLMQVPPDERYDALYPFVLGLFLKAQGDHVGAKKSFQKAIALDGAFLMARRELGTLEAAAKPQKQDIFTMDLKQVVSGFFNPKTKR